MSIKTTAVNVVKHKHNQSFLTRRRPQWEPQHVKRRLAVGERTVTKLAVVVDVAEVSDIDFHMQYWIYQPLRTEGFIAANLLGFTVLVVDQAFLHLRRRRKLLKMTNLPLHKLRQREEWEQLVDSMEGGDEADVERFVMPTDNTAEAERERLRKQFAAQEAEREAAEEEESEIPEEAEKDLVGEFEGTEEGLKGELEADEDLRTVRDIWRRIEEDEG